MKAQAKYQWICTDGSIAQYGRQITDQIFEFKEAFIEPRIIDLREYQTKEIEHIINAYGYTLLTGRNQAAGLVNIHQSYPHNTNWIIAECIFESENPA